MISSCRLLGYVRSKYVLPTDMMTVRETSECILSCLFGKCPALTLRMIQFEGHLVCD
jgi:hypothetical protein